MKILEKVTCFVQNNKQQIALFKHPFGGVQIPAGTVESEESAKEAALREAREETGLKQLKIIKLLGVEDIYLPEDSFAIFKQATIYSRPDAGSFDWASIRRGIYVKRKRVDNEWSQISYCEKNNSLNPEYITYEITGWTKTNLITNHLRRRFYLISASEKTESSWTVNADNHTFRLFWGSNADRKKVQIKQKPWLAYLKHKASK
jgi:8-oxo-dGTP pyrophosphatase MutT (NUDIX family)